jgi:nucleotide-binding universal stress UspA family protein
MKNILLLVHDDAGQEARLQAALDVTRAVEGHLNCLDVLMMPAIAGDFWDGGGTAMLLDDARRTAAANRTRLEQRLGAESLPWSWIDASGDLASCLERAAVLNELIVVNRRLDGFPYPDMRTAASDLVVRSGKPILAVPEKATGFAAAGRAMIAWDGSVQCDAALQAALPLLRLASEVSLVEIDDGSIDIPAEEAAAFLSRHDVHAEIVRTKIHEGGVGGTLLRQVDERQTDYLVMGAFGHSRVSEALLGGVTRMMLTRSPVPLFLAH